MGRMAAATAPHDQLSLLPADDLPVQARLDRHTREVGLAGIAHARAVLEEANTARRLREADEQARRAADQRPHRPAAVPQVQPPQAA
jgi:hypothetical protein